MTETSACPHARLVAAEYTGPGVGARCLTLLERIVRRYAPKTKSLKTVALSFEEQQTLLASGMMQKPDLSEMEAIHARALRYKYGRKVAYTPGKRPMGKPPLQAVVDATKEAIDYMDKHGREHGYISWLARRRNVNYCTLKNSIQAALSDRKRAKA